MKSEEQQQRISEAQYLQLERSSATKSQYWRGEIFAMAGASRKHNLIVANLIRELGSRLKNRPCRVYPSDMRLKIEATGLYTYPDVTVVCGEELFADEKMDTLLNPLVIVEVLSDSTERYDRGEKFGHYRRIESLREYLLIAQHQEKMERFFKNEQGLWTLTETDEEHSEIQLECLGCALSTAEIYDKV